MLTDDKNFFHTHRNIHSLFSDLNKELTKVNEWFVAKKRSLNVKKSKYSFFPINLVIMTIFLFDY